MAGRFAHRDGETTLLVTPRDERDDDRTGLSASLDLWMTAAASPEDDPTHSRWHAALQRQRAEAIAARERDRQRASLQAIEEVEERQRLAEELRSSQRLNSELAAREREVARREEALRETGQSMVAREDAVHRLEGLLAENKDARDAQARALANASARVDQLSSELSETKAALRESERHADELGRAEAASSSQLLDRDAELVELRGARQAAEAELARRADEFEHATARAAEHFRARAELEARFGQSEHTRAELAALLATAEARRADAAARADRLEAEAIPVLEARIGALVAEVERALVMGEIRAEGAARLTEKKTEADLHDREEEAWRAENEVRERGCAHARTCCDARRTNTQQLQRMHTHTHAALRP